MPERPSLVRSLGRVSLVALVVNCTIGTGVFILPGTVAGLLGWRALGAWILAGALTGVVVACAAEVASRYDRPGGPYLYAHEAFGRFVGLQIGWIAYLMRVVSASVQVGLLAAYVGEFWPAAGTQAGQFVTGTVLLGALAVINIRGVSRGALTSTFFAVSKFIPLLAFGLAGILWLGLGRAPASVAASDVSLHGWLRSILFLVFAFGGFEAAILPASEAREPRRDVPFALGAGLAAVVLIYLVVQVAVLATLGAPGETTRPLAAAARVMGGRVGAMLIAATAVFAVYGWLAGQILNVPRLTMAMAERGDLPAVFGLVHPVFRTPWVSILAFVVLAWLLSFRSTLLANVSLSAVSRLVTYGLMCAALPALRAREGRVPPALFRAPGGQGLAALGVLLSLGLVARMTGREAITLGVTVALATVHWLVIRHRPVPSSSEVH